MKALSVKNTKELMSLLLTGEAFDLFFTEKCTLTTFMTYEINGAVKKGYFSAEEEKLLAAEYETGYVLWKRVKPVIFSAVKGDRPPLSFNIVLHAGDNYMKRLKERTDLGEAADALIALTLNIRFENGNLTLMTGSSYSTFVVSRVIDDIWDSDLITSMDTLGIKYDII